jgi:hypothetical protein
MLQKKVWFPIATYFEILHFIKRAICNLRTFGNTITDSLRLFAQTTSYIIISQCRKMHPMSLHSGLFSHPDCFEIYSTKQTIYTAVTTPKDI